MLLIWEELLVYNSLMTRLWLWQTLATVCFHYSLIGAMRFKSLCLRHQQISIQGQRQHWRSPLSRKLISGNCLCRLHCHGVLLPLLSALWLSKIIGFILRTISDNTCHKQSDDVSLFFGRHDAFLILLYNSLLGWCLIVCMWRNIKNNSTLSCLAILFGVSPSL